MPSDKVGQLEVAIDGELAAQLGKLKEYLEKHWVDIIGDSTAIETTVDTAIMLMEQLRMTWPGK